jgi:hypothetical protein
MSKSPSLGTSSTNRGGSIRGGSAGTNGAIGGATAINGADGGGRNEPKAGGDPVSTAIGMAWVVADGALESEVPAIDAAIDAAIAAAAAAASAGVRAGGAVAVAVLALSP